MWGTLLDALRTAQATARQKHMNMNVTRSRKALNAFLDALSNLCYTQINVEQDHHFAGDGRCAFHGSGGSYRAIMHALQRARATSVQAGLLR
jgi:hypothetical protein